MFALCNWWHNGEKAIRMRCLSQILHTLFFLNYYFYDLAKADYSVFVVYTYMHPIRHTYITYSSDVRDKSSLIEVSL